MAKIHVASAAAGGHGIGIELALGLAVERLRQARNLSIDDLARLSRLPLAIVHAIESGEGSAQAAHVAALSTALGVRPAALLVFVMPGDERRKEGLLFFKKEGLPYPLAASLAA